jgi:predicted NBD/HSP70 family sugar kinase
MSEPVLGGVEAGGTKFVCVVGRGPGPVLAEERIPTTTPAETLGRAVAFFRAAERRHGPCAAFAGVCPFHRDSLEGLASGPAGLARWGAPLETLGADHPAWDVLGFYLGHLCASATMLLSPHVIVMGGGVTRNASLLPAVRRWLPRPARRLPAVAAPRGLVRLVRRAARALRPRRRSRRARARQ